MIRRATLALAAVVPGVAMIFILHAFGSNSPMWDEWRWADIVVKYDSGALRFADVWDAYNGHRIFVPSLIALGLSRFGGWDVLREMYFSLALVILSQLVVYRLLVESLPRARVAPAFLVASLLLFSLGQSDNWLWGFELSWFLVNLCLLLVVLVLSNDRLGPARAAVALTAAAVAAFSLASGLNVLAAGLFLLVARRPPARRLAVAWVAFSGVLCAAYLWRLSEGATTVLFSSAGIAGQFVYFLTFLGAPAGRAGGASWSLVLGTLVAVGAAAAFIRFARLRRTDWAQARRRMPWLAILLYSFLGGCMIAAGRSGIQAGGDVYTATSSRYVTVGLLAWVALVALAALELPPVSRLSEAARFAYAAGACVLLVSFASGDWAEYRALPAFRDYLLEMSSAVWNYRSYGNAELEARTFPLPPGVATFPSNFWLGPARLRELIAGLQRYREGPFLGRD